MKTKPFNTADVQAIMTGRKTMFREVIKGYGNIMHYGKLLGEWSLSRPPLHLGDIRWRWQLQTDVDDWSSFYFKSRFKVNDIIPVKESWQHTKCLNINPEDENYGYVYKSDGQPWNDLEGWTWHSPVTMPAEAHRLFVKITGVKAERLQDISEEDAIKEGIMPSRYDVRNLFEIKCGREQWQSNQWRFAYSFKVVEKP